ncbi:MAG: hypothetical protein AOA66_0723 [Candidatus Bathyarchaeota archaeon BA2]|nr:MAG: hypothetical protein AOA66_0723 [Candidatus Bathyarchaeota archaeon BA2]
MTEVSPVMEKIAERKTIVYKSRVDPSVVKLTAEKMKNKLFIKFGFSKPRPEEIRVVSVDKYYEPYVIIDGRYSVDYYKKRVCTFDVDMRTEKVKILDKAFKPESIVSPTGETRKVIRLEAEESFSYEDKAYIILDKSGREIPPDEVPSAPSEDHPQKILKEFGKKSGKVKISPRKGVEIVKSRIVNRPPDADKVENELFQISEHTVIYNPIYEITFRNLKTGEEKVIKIDGVTAKIIS